jgi:hypothetical protein
VRKLRPAVVHYWHCQHPVLRPVSGIANYVLVGPGGEMGSLASQWSRLSFNARGVWGTRNQKLWASAKKYAGFGTRLAVTDSMPWWVPDHDRGGSGARNYGAAYVFELARGCGTGGETQASGAPLDYFGVLGPLRPGGPRRRADMTARAAYLFAPSGRDLDEVHRLRRNTGHLAIVWRCRGPGWQCDFDRRVRV